MYLFNEYYGFKRGLIVTQKKKCHCGSAKEYKDCCGYFHDGYQWPADPLSLMRSRYSAFVEGRVDYIAKTMRDWACLDFNEESTKQFCEQASWLGLEIIDYKYDKGAAEGQVEFVARYHFDDSEEVDSIHERSLFKRVNGLWFYVSAVYDSPFAKEELSEA
jgi:SEC-C motif domain protein